MAPVWIEANGVSLRVEHRAGRGPCLVLLHEMGGTLETWDEMMPRLAGRATVRFDARGAGLSEKLTAPPSIDDLAADVGAVLDRLDIAGPVVPVGCAVGAAVALRFRTLAPGRVAAMVLASAATGLAPEKVPASLAAAAEVEGGRLRARADARLDNSFPPSLRTDPARVAAFRLRLLSNDPASYGAVWRMLATVDLEADVAAAMCPVLVLAGRLDGTRPPEDLRRLADRLPDGRFELVESGHVMPALAPGAMADRVLAFLSDLGL